MLYYVLKKCSLACLSMLGCPGMPGKAILIVNLCVCNLKTGGNFLFEKGVYPKIFAAAAARGLRQVTFRHFEMSL